ncbi:hypothetical protein KR009_001788, partial [Drosophila setifemur]
MPEEVMVPAGSYKLNKRFRADEYQRRKKDMPWTKRVLDLDKRRLCGRTAWEWTRIVLGYLFLYLLICIVLLFWIVIFWVAIIKKDRPHWAKAYPGISMVPTNSNTIEFYENIPSDVYPITNQIEQFLRKLPDNAEEFFSECNVDESWGYTVRNPCIFIRLNKLIGYKPDTYEEPKDLPSSAPSELPDIVTKFDGSPKIWLTCTTDEGPSPMFGFIPGPYYPASTDMKGVDRVVAVQLNKMKANVRVTITCTVWAKNIPVNYDFNGSGHVRFTMHLRMETANKP